MCRICQQATGRMLYVDHTGGGYVHGECLMQERDLLTEQLRTSNGSLLSLLTGIEALVNRGRLVLTGEEQAWVDRCHDAVFVKVEMLDDARRADTTADEN